MGSRFRASNRADLSVVPFELPLAADQQYRWTDIEEVLLQNEVQPSLLDIFATQARKLVSELESGHEIDLRALAQGIGSTLEYMLCDLFLCQEATSAYWVDGVVLSTPTLLPDGSIIATGYAWCAENRVQWQVPVQVNFSLGDCPGRAVKFLKIRVGDARKATLHAHRTHRPWVTPLEWLLEFNVAPA